MQQIREHILQWWYKKEPDVLSASAITGFAIRELYLLYDQYAFHNQLSRRLIEINEFNAYKTILKFDQNLIPPKDAHIQCGISNYFQNGVKIISFKLSVWAISRVSLLNERQLLDTIGTDSIGMAFLLIFEHQLTHLIFTLWEQEGYYPNAHNPLFTCVHNSFFNDGSISSITHTNVSRKNYDIVSIIEKSKSYPPLPLSYAKYTYNNNSCYLDSLLTVLFFNKSPVFRDAIFTTNVGDVNYIEVKGVFKSPCTSSITKNEFVNVVQKLQSFLFTDYMSLINGTAKECMDVRLLLSECYPDMVEKDNNIKSNKTEGAVKRGEVVPTSPHPYSSAVWVMYSAPEIYDLFAYAFPKLMCYDYPCMIKNKFRKSTERRSMFTFWEFMEPTEDNLKYMLWDQFDCEVLVFRNGGFPAITNYGDIKPENIRVPSFKNGKRVMITESIKKDRAFGEHIINDRYEMVGAIMLHGSEPGKSGGAHYTAYVKIKSDKKKNTSSVWMEYNDIGNVWKITGSIQHIKGKERNTLGSFPHNILIEEGGVKPEMYFYKKL